MVKKKLIIIIIVFHAINYVVPAGHVSSLMFHSIFFIITIFLMGDTIF